MNPHYDILIIGNGIIGCMSALKLELQTEDTCAKSIMMKYNY